jgi:hypothetical protein
MAVPRHENVFDGLPLLDGYRFMPTAGRSIWNKIAAK